MPVVTDTNYCKIGLLIIFCQILFLTKSSQKVRWSSIFINSPTVLFCCLRPSLPLSGTGERTYFEAFDCAQNYMKETFFLMHNYVNSSSWKFSCATRCSQNGNLVLESRFSNLLKSYRFGSLRTAETIGLSLIFALFVF